VRWSSTYLQGLLGAATPAGPGSARTLRPPRRIFDAAPEPEIASPSRPETVPDPLETVAAPVQSVPAGEPGAGQSAPAAFASPGTAPAGPRPFPPVSSIPPVPLIPPVPSVNAAGPESQDFFFRRSPQAFRRSTQAVPAIDRLPDATSAVSRIGGAGPASAYGDDRADVAEEVPPFPAGPSRVVRHPVMDQPPAVADAPAAGRPLIVDHASMGRPPAGVPAMPVGRTRQDAPRSAPGSDDARPGAARPPTLNPTKTSSDSLSPQFAVAAGPGGRQPAAGAVRSQVTIGTIEVTVVPPSAPPAVPPIPVPAPVGPVAPAGRRGAGEAARMGSRRWFGAGQG
jgi:hypothetical protein